MTWADWVDEKKTQRERECGLRSSQHPQQKQRQFSPIKRVMTFYCYYRWFRLRPRMRKYFICLFYVCFISVIGSFMTSSPDNAAVSNSLFTVHLHCSFLPVYCTCEIVKERTPGLSINTHFVSLGPVLHSAQRVVWWPWGSFWVESMSNHSPIMVTWWEPSLCLDWTGATLCFVTAKALLVVLRKTVNVCAVLRTIRDGKICIVLEVLRLFGDGKDCSLILFSLCSSFRSIPSLTSIWSK